MEAKITPKRRYKIVQIDDHTIVADHIRKLINSSVPGCSFNHFQNGDDAYGYVSDCIKKDENIDLVITDIIHPGIDGYTFACNIRKMEKEAGRNPLIILVLSVQDGSLPRYRKAVQEKIFNEYVQLDAKSEVLMSAVKRGLGIV